MNIIRYKINNIILLTVIIIILCTFSFMLGKKKENIDNREVHKDLMIIRLKASSGDKKAYKLFITMYNNRDQFSNKDFVNSIESNYSIFKDSTKNDNFPDGLKNSNDENQEETIGRTSKTKE